MKKKTPPDLIVKMKRMTKAKMRKKKEAKMKKVVQKDPP